ncbi:MAG: FGE-sulfatase protein, partial [Gammaproteobacteria bacterium]|nr:FGE-sulfatase protein [Gammaproteobacteria bacterium]
MTSKNLRALAKDYANGILAKDAYRKARNELIEGILSGAVEVIPNNYPRTVEHQDLESTGDRTAIFLEREQKQTPSPQPTKPSKQSQPSSQQITSHPWIIGSAAVAIICLIVIVVLFAQRKEIPPPVVIDAAPPTATAELPIPPIQSIKGQQLIEDFLRQNNWSDESLQRFVTDWQAMSPVDQSDGLASPAMTQLKNAIYRQFSEERALFKLGDAEKVIARQNSLAGFAQQSGTNDPRLVVEGLETQTTIAMPAEDAVQPIEPAVEETAAIPQVTEPPEPAPIE